MLRRVLGNSLEVEAAEVMRRRMRPKLEGETQANSKVASPETAAATYGQLSGQACGEDGGPVTRRVDTNRTAIMYTATITYSTTNYRLRRRYDMKLAQVQMSLQLPAPRSPPAMSAGGSPPMHDSEGRTVRDSLPSLAPV